jgi:hypothetical protein
MLGEGDSGGKFIEVQYILHSSFADGLCYGTKLS